MPSFVRSLVLWIFLCMMFSSTAWWNYELPFTYRYYILDIILLELEFFISWRFCINDVAAFVILFLILNCRHLFFGTSVILPFMYRYCILDIILLELDFFISWRFCINDVAAFVILFFILKCRHLFFGTSPILLCLQGIMYAIFPTSQMHLYG